MVGPIVQRPALLCWPPACPQELAEARGSVAQLTDECARLRADNQSLSNEVAQLREALDQVQCCSCSELLGDWGP